MQYYRVESKDQSLIRSSNLIGDGSSVRIIPNATFSLNRRVHFFIFFLTHCSCKLEAVPWSLNRFRHDFRHDCPMKVLSPHQSPINIPRIKPRQSEVTWCLKNKKNFHFNFTVLLLLLLLLFIFLFYYSLSDETSPPHSTQFSPSAIFTRQTTWNRYGLIHGHLP